MVVLMGSGRGTLQSVVVVVVEGLLVSMLVLLRVCRCKSASASVLKNDETNHWKTGASPPEFSLTCRWSEREKPGLLAGGEPRTAYYSW